MAGQAMYGVGASSHLRAQYAQQMQELANAEYLQLQVPNGAETEPYSPYAPYESYGPPPGGPAGWNGDDGIYVEPDQYWGGDPGIYAEPQPGFEGDPGILAAPPAVPAEPDVYAPEAVEPPHARVLAPSIVPGLDWITGGPYHDLGPVSPESLPHDAPTGPPNGEPAAPPATTDPIAAMDAGDHMAAGARGFLVPSLLGGVVAGAFAASAARGSGLGAPIFASRVIGNVAMGVATGVGAGLLVSATSPTSSDSLAARYAVAGGILGAAGGAAFPGGTSRAFSAVLGGVSGAVVAGFTGARLQNQS